MIDRLRTRLVFRALAREDAVIRRENISHDKMLEHFGYKPDQARIRIRHEQPPVTNPKVIKRRSK